MDYYLLTDARERRLSWLTQSGQFTHKVVTTGNHRLGKVHCQRPTS